MRMTRKKATRALSLNHIKNLANSKRSVSPVIATVLLVAISIVLAIIVFLWATKFIGEVVTKGNSPAEQKCGEVNLEVTYIGSEVQVANKGQVYVYRADIFKVVKGEENSAGYIEKLGAGMSDKKDIGSAEEVKVVPIILGQAGEKKVAYTCKDNVFVAE